MQLLNYKEIKVKSSIIKPLHVKIYKLQTKVETLILIDGIKLGRLTQHEGLWYKLPQSDTSVLYNCSAINVIQEIHVSHFLSLPRFFVKYFMFLPCILTIRCNLKIWQKAYLDGSDLPQSKRLQVWITHTHKNKIRKSLTVMIRELTSAWSSCQVTNTASNIWQKCGECAAFCQNLAPANNLTCWCLKINKYINQL